MATVKDYKSIGKPFRNALEIRRIVYDFSVDAGATGDLDLFIAADDIVVHGFYANVKTACTSGGSMVLDVGATGQLEIFLKDKAVASLTAGSVQKSPLVLAEAAPNTGNNIFPVKIASGEKCIMNIGTATLTAGKIEFVFLIGKF